MSPEGMAPAMADEELDLAALPGGSGGIDTSAGSLLSRQERRRLAIRLTLALTAGGLLILAMILRRAFPGQADLADLVAGTAAILVGVPILIEAASSLRHPTLHGVTDQLVAVALIAAWAVGDLETAALVPLAMVIGHVLEERSLLGSRDAIETLARFTRTMARIIHDDGTIQTAPSHSLLPGQRVEVRPGDRVPADGLVRSGVSSVDTSPISGESVPVEVAPGDGVGAGSINQYGRLEVEVTRTGDDTILGRVVSLMRSAEEAKPPVTRLLERFAGPYLILVLLVAGCALEMSGRISVMMTMIVASCPCALVLAAPSAAIAAIAVAGRHGILVRSSAFLERLAEVDAVVLDKTGTVTMGALRVVEQRPEEPGSDGARRLLTLAGSLGAASSHPISRAVAAAVPSPQRLALSGIVEHSGQGVSGRWEGVPVSMGRRDYVAREGIAVPESPRHDGPLVAVGAGGAFLGWILLADQPRAEARVALEDLRALGLTRHILLTGDRRSVAEEVARNLGIDEVVAEVVPEQKLHCVEAEIRAGHHPLVVGDGINDALALKAGAVGVAMGANGTDVALASADLVLTSSDLRRLGTCIRLSRQCRRTITVNVAIGLAWTLVIVAGAALGLFGPFVAVILHNVGTLAVMANAGRLLRFDETLVSLDGPATALP